MVHVYIGSDHAGYRMKQLVIALLKEQKLTYTDLGGFSEDVEDDYPDITAKVCKEVLHDTVHRVGVLICGSGIGESIAANRFHNIRASLCWNVETAMLARRHNHANVLCIGGRVMTEEQIEAVLRTWFTTAASDAERHVRRIKKIDTLG